VKKEKGMNPLLQRLSIVGAVLLAATASGARAAIPDPPTLKSVTPGAAGTLNVTLAWAAPANNGGAAISTYVVSRFTNGVKDQNSAYPSTSTGANMTCANFGVPCGWIVSATNFYGSSKPSNTITVTLAGVTLTPTPRPTATPTPAPSLLPSAPTLLSVTQAAAGSLNVTLSWKAPTSTGGSAIATYQIARFTNGAKDAGYAYPATSTGANLSCKMLGVTCGFTVAAANGSGVGPASNLITITPR
jgi:hypothetical protein